MSSLYSKKKQKAMAKAYGDNSRNLDDIADEFGVSRNTITRYGKKFNVKRLRHMPKTRKAGRTTPSPYSEKKQKAMAEAYGDTSRNLDDIADEFGVSQKTIRKYATKYGFERDEMFNPRSLSKAVLDEIQDLYENTSITLQELAKKFNVGERTISRKMKKRGTSKNSKYNRKLTSEQVDQLQSDYVNEVPVSDIAEKYNVSTRTVRKYGKETGHTQLANKISEEKLSVIRQEFERTSKTTAQIARLYDVSPDTITKYAKNRYWMRTQKVDITNKDNWGYDAPPEDEYVPSTEPFKKVSPDKMEQEVRASFRPGQNEVLDRVIGGIKESKKVGAGKGRVDKERTMNDMIKSFGINTDVWDIEMAHINVWQVYSNDSGKHDLYQTKLKLTRKELLLPKVVVPHPIKINPKEYNTHNPPRRNVKRALIIPDTQVGFVIKDTFTWIPTHYREGMELTLQVAKEMRPDDIVLLGDMLDLPELAAVRMQDAYTQGTSEPAFFELGYYIRELRRHTGRLVYIEGNHEKRYMRQLVKSGLVHAKIKRFKSNVDEIVDNSEMSLPSFLDLQGQDIIYWGGDYATEYPQRKKAFKLNDNMDLQIFHGNKARKGGGRTVANMVSDMFHSAIVGHTHRLETASKTLHLDSGSQTIHVWSAGCLCKTDGTVPANSREPDWQNAFIIVDYNDEGFYNIKSYLINTKNHSVIVDGKTYYGRSYFPEFNDEYGVFNANIIHTDESKHKK